MPQNEWRVTAPTDPDPKWPEGYVAVLREAGAKEKTIPFCIGWVRRFFSAFPGRSRRELGRAEIETFLSETAARPEISNWQVQQARDALELYYEKFRGIALAPRASVSVNHPQTPVDHVSPPVAVPQASEAPTTVGIQEMVAQYPKPFVNVKGGKEECLRSEVRGRRSEGGTLNAERSTPNAEVEGEKDAPEGRAPPGSAGTSAVRGPEGEATGGDACPSGVGTCNWEALEERLRDCLRVENYAYATEKTYAGWIRRYVSFHGWRKPSTLVASDVHAFLRHLAVNEQVAAATQNQAA